MRRLLAALLVVGLAGCGEDEPARQSASSPAPTATPTATASAANSPAGDPESRAVAAVIERYAASVRAGDAETICTRLLSRSVLRRVESAGGDCERDLIADAVAEGGASYRVVVEAIDVRGDRATARTQVTDREGTRPQAQLLVREGGRWRLST